MMTKILLAGLNLAESFEGLGVTPWLEMEIETAGIVSSSNGVLY